MCFTSHLRNQYQFRLRLMNILVDSSVCCSKGLKLSVFWENIPLITEMEKLRLSTVDLQGNAAFHFVLFSLKIHHYMFSWMHFHLDIPAK